MRLLETLFGARKARRINDLAQEISQRCCAAVWGRVHQRVLAMSPAEARGYIWAQSAEAVQAELEAALQRHSSFDRNRMAVLKERARDLLATTLLSEVVRVQKTSVNRRLAA